MIFIRYPSHCNLKVLDLGERLSKAHQIKDEIAFSLGYNGFSLLQNGKVLLDEDVVADYSTVHVCFSLPGGKGGFGSMLRAIGAQIEKTTNREACRDLSGRRLRDINEEQRLKKWISKEAEREAEKIKRRQARIERLKTKAPHKFFDYEYEKEISELPDRINNALTEGLEKSKQPKKRSHEISESRDHPKKSWLADEFSDTSSDSDSGGRKCSPKKMKITPEGSCNQSMEEESPEMCSSVQKTQQCKKKTLKMSKSEENPKYCTDGQLAGTSSDSDTNKGNIHKLIRGNDCLPVEDSSEPTPCSSQGLQVTEEILELREYQERFRRAQHFPGSSSDDDSDKSSGCALRGLCIDSKNNLSQNESMQEDKPDSNKEIQSENPTEKCCDKTVKRKEESVRIVVQENVDEVMQDDSPIDLMDFQSVSELEALGLDKLKSALMMRGLKCGGKLSDRAERLWKIRDLEPHEYPASLLAKTKK